MDGLEEQDPSGITLERNIAHLEHGQHALVFSSGLAACCAITKLVSPGDHVLLGDDTYGGSYHLVESVLSQYKISVSHVNISKPDEMAKSIQANTKLLWLECPSGPLLRLADIKKLSELANKHGIFIVVDNTLATSYFQKPLTLGADIVLHSSVKQLSGRKDIIAGAVVTNRADLFEKLQSYRHSSRTAVEPADCFAILKGMRTLSQRMQQQEKSAKKIAVFLTTHPSVQKVHYPGLNSFPQHELACKQMSGFGSMLTFELKEGSEAATNMLRSIRLFDLANKVNYLQFDSHKGSLIHSTISHAKLPASMQGKNKTNGIVSVIRLAIGLENADELINDLAQSIRVADHHLVQFPEAATVQTANLRECV